MKDSKWLKERLDMVFKQDAVLEENQICNSQFYIYGNSLLQLHNEAIVHGYLYSNLLEILDLSDLE